MSNQPFEIVHFEDNKGAYSGAFRGAKRLQGKVVESVWISDNQQDIKFVTDGGSLMYATDADCCSETWFSDIYGLDALIGHMILEVNTITLPKYNAEDGRSRQEYDAVYGLKIRTLAGYTDIVFRNSSNGSYGGHAEYINPSDLPYPSYEISANWCQITGNDWSA